jgi:hypothetical protein
VGAGDFLGMRYDEVFVGTFDGERIGESEKFLGRDKLPAGTAFGDDYGEDVVFGGVEAADDFTTGDEGDFVLRSAAAHNDGNFLLTRHVGGHEDGDKNNTVGGRSQKGRVWGKK